ncbi:MAG: GtrA family protein [Bryobacteraceae bacterium]|jgi:putative flippase GtrA
MVPIRTHPITRFLKYNAVGVLGTTLRTSTLALLHEVVGLGYVSATALAVEAGMLHNFSWHLHWTWRERCAGITWQETLLRLLKYQASNGAVAMAVNLLAVRVLVGGLGLHYLVANLFATAAAGIVNFAIAEFLIFRWPWIEAAAPASSCARS